MRSKAMRIMSAARTLTKWYASPVSLLYGLMLGLSAAAALAGFSVVALLILIAAVGIVVPWKLLRQRDESRAHLAQIAELQSVVDRLDSQVMMTPTFDHVEKTLAGFRKGNQKAIRSVRKNMVDLRLAQAEQTRLSKAQAGQLAELTSVAGLAGEQTPDAQSR